MALDDVPGLLQLGFAAAVTQETSDVPTDGSKYALKLRGNPQDAGARLIVPFVMDRERR